MRIRYLYLDDGDKSESETFATALAEQAEGLQIVTDYPANYSTQIESLHSITDADGIILDLRLDQLTNEVDGRSRRADYRAPALAQEIRSRAAENRDALNIPIILLSSDEKLKESFRRDHTSHDLFDLILIKGDLLDTQKTYDTSQKLVALAEGYKKIADLVETDGTKKDLFVRLLGFNSVQDASFLPPEIQDPFLALFSNARFKLPAHEYARFIIKHLLDVQGPLIDEMVLLARLGLTASGDAQKLLDDYFTDAKYSSVFSDGWPRWWEHKVLEVWAEKFSGESLRSLPANERVKILTKKSRLKGLEAPRPLHASYSTSFWTICQKLGAPLDPKDGLIMNIRHEYDWQARLYVSVEAFNQRKIQASQIHPIDKPRLDLLKKTHISK